jgi:ABC-type sugar transport system ATPase subunit
VSLGPLVRIDAVSKKFPGIQALDRVSLEIMRGEVHAVIGENGAGKSTLMRILAGAETPDEGGISLDGRQVRFSNPLDARNAGIGIVYQELSVFPNLDIAENIFSNRQPGVLGLMRRGVMRARARELLELFSLDLDPRTPLGSLSMADRQSVEVLRAVSLEPKLLILDEPTSSLTQSEVDTLFGLLARLKDRGISILYVSHQLQEVLRLSDRISVLRDGKLIGTVEKSAATEADLVRMMVGRAVELYSSSRESRSTDVAALEVRDLCMGSAVRNVTFSLHRGEILGVSGLVGAGRSELARTLFGLTPPTAGHVLVEGLPFGARSPRSAIARGIAYVPEDRKTVGLFLPMLIRENMIAPQLFRLSRHGLVDERGVDRLTVEYINRVGIAARGPRQRALTLSGGNQQKLMLSLWLALHPKVLIVDEPTRGIDVGAKVEIHNLLQTLAGEGIAVMLISSELPEILRLSDRVAVMHEGSLAGILTRGEATQERIMTLAAGVRRDGSGS